MSGVKKLLQAGSKGKKEPKNAELKSKGTKNK